MLNFDVGWVPWLECVVDLSFHDRLLVSTLGPVVAMGLLLGTYAIAVRRNLGRPTNCLHRVRQKHLSMALVVTFLVYCSVSSTVLQAFPCEILDDGHSYLRVDNRSQCNVAEHQALKAYAAAMVCVYPIGVPMLYASLLYQHRHVLKDEERRKGNVHVQFISGLWEPYKPDRFYFELFECVRRVSLTSVVAFIEPNSTAQIAIMLLIGVAYAVFAEVLSPFLSVWDKWIARAGHVIVFLSMYTALLLKANMAGELHDSRTVFAVLLVVLHVGLVIAVLAQAVVMLSAARRQHTLCTELRRRAASRRI